MISDIVDFFKGLFWSEDSDQDEDLNNEPTNNSKNNDLASEDSDSNNGNDALPTPTAPHDADNKEGSLGHLDVHCDYLELSTWDKFEQNDPNPKVYFSYTVKTELTHDFLVQNPWVQDAISGSAISDDIKMIEIEYVAKPNICPEYKHQEHVVKTAQLNLLGGTTYLTNCDNKETSAYIDSVKVTENCKDISFAISDSDRNSYHVDLHYTDTVETDPSLAQPDTDNPSNPGWAHVYCACFDAAEMETKFRQDDSNAMVYFNYTTKTEPEAHIKLTLDYLEQNPWVVDAISGSTISDELTMVEIEYAASYDICASSQDKPNTVNTAHVDLLGKEIHLTNCYDQKIADLPLEDASISQQEDFLCISFSGMDTAGECLYNLTVDYDLS